MNTSVMVGQLVRVRDEDWVVEDCTSSSGSEALSCRNLRTARSQLFLVPPEHVEQLAAPPLNWALGLPREWRNFHDAWELSARQPPDALASLLRGRVVVDEYQLVPVSQALARPLPRLLLADDVGLGKTIEAGLIMLELIQREQAGRILVIVPSGLRAQWQQELQERVGLRFQIFGPETRSQVMQELPRGANPWRYLDRVIVSIDYIRRGRERDAILRSQWDLIVVDEAHAAAISGTPEYPVSTLRHRIIRELAQPSRTRALLLLTATPHNGYSHSFRSLVELVDPYAGGPSEVLTPERLRTIMTRRLKRGVFRCDGTPHFRERRVLPLPVDDLTDGERRLFDLVHLFCNELRAGAARSQEEQTVAFATTVIRKRMLSSRAALATTLRRWVDAKPEAAATPLDLESLRANPAPSEEENERQEELVVQKAAIAFRGRRRVRARLAEILDCLQGLEETPDTKGSLILRKLHELLDPDPQEKVIIFTEYRDTLDWLAGILGGDGSWHYEKLVGGLTLKQRQAVEARFARAQTRILLATDAASEGLNLQDHCHLMIHNELPWNPNRLEQRNGRIHRWGQTRDCIIYNVYIPHSPESRVLQRLMMKLEEIGNAIGSVNDVLGALVDIEAHVGAIESDEEADALAAREEERLERLKEAFETGAVEGLPRAQTFVKEDCERLRPAIEQALRLVPSGEHLRAFLESAIPGVRFEPDLRDGQRPIIYKASFARAPWDRYVTSAGRRVTFDREVACQREFKDVEFIGPGHPLVLAATRLYRSKLYDVQFSHRVSHRVVDAGIPGILFTFFFRLRRTSPVEAVEEKLVPVFCSLEGAVSHDPEADDRLYRQGGLPTDAPAALLDGTFRPRFDELISLACEEAAGRIEAWVLERRRQLEAQRDQLLSDLEVWDRAMRNELQARAAGAVVGGRRPQQLELEMEDTDLEQTLAQHQLRVEERRHSLQSLPSVEAAEEPLLLGALVIVPKQMLEA